MLHRVTVGLPGVMLPAMAIDADQTLSLLAGSIAIQPNGRSRIAALLTQGDYCLRLMPAKYTVPAKTLAPHLTSWAIHARCAAFRLSDALTIYTHQRAFKSYKV